MSHYKKLLAVESQLWDLFPTVKSYPYFWGVVTFQLDSITCAVLEYEPARTSGTGPERAAEIEPTFQLVLSELYSGCYCQHFSTVVCLLPFAESSTHSPFDSSGATQTNPSAVIIWWDSFWLVHLLYFNNMFRELTCIAGSSATVVTPGKRFAMSH